MKRLASLLVLVATGVPRPVFAQTVDELVERGVELRRAGKDAEALEVFRRAYAQSESSRALAQIALAHQALGHWLDAEKKLTEALEAGGPWIERNRGPLEGALETIREHLAWIEIRGSPVGATVEVDDRVVGTLPLDGPVRIVAGDVVIRVSAEGYETVTRTVSIAGDRRAREIFDLVLTTEDVPIPGPEDRSGRGSIDFGVPLESTLLIELGYSAIPRVSYLVPVASWFAVGLRAGLDVGLFHSLGEDVPGTLTVSAAVPFRFAIVDSSRIGVQLGLTPGIGFTSVDYLPRIGGSDDLGFDLVGEYAAVILHGSLDIGYRLGRVVTLGGGVEVPAALFFGGGTDIEELVDEILNVDPFFDADAVPPLTEFSVVPILVGPTVELRLSDTVSLGAKVRLGPHTTYGDLAEFTSDSGDDSVTELGLQAQLGLAFAL